MRRLSSSIRRLSKTELTITRTESSSLLLGRKVVGAQSTFNIRCSVQPMSDKELMMLPEGERTQSKFTLWTDTLLKVIDDPDECVYEGTEYVIQAVTDWAGTTDYGSYRLVKKLQVAI